MKRPRDGGEVLAALTAFRYEVARAPAPPGGPPVRGTGRSRGSARWHRSVLLAVAGLAALAVASAAARFLWYREKARAPDPSAAVAPSIAVLPFADMSPQKDQEYFADGIAEEILNALAHVDGLRVPGRTSCFYFKGKSVKLADVGRELRVGNVLEGSVRKDGERLRITAQLVRVDDEAHLWSQTYDWELKGVFAVQEEIAKAVVDALKVKLSPEGGLAHLRPRSPEAYSEYMLGRHLYFSRASEDGTAVARQHFERAVALDPDYAPAWAFLSITLTQRAVDSNGMTSEDQQRALAAAGKAISLAPEESIGYVARAFLRNMVLWDWEGTRADVERALTLRESHLSAFNQKSLLLSKLGRAREAVGFARQATEFDPLNTVYWGNLAWAYMDVDDLVSARAALARSTEIAGKPNPGTAGNIELFGGNAEAMLALFQTVTDEADRLTGIAIASHLLGRETESDRALALLVEKYGKRWPYAVAVVYVWRGQGDLAFEWAERAYEQHDLGVARIKGSHGFRRLRNDPRYAALLRKLNLPLD